MLFLAAGTTITLASIGAWLFNRPGRTSARQSSGPNLLLPPGVKPTLPLSSVLPRDKDVFASTEEGLFRIVRDEMRWQRLALTDTMPVNGFFVQQPPSVADIFYVTPRLQNDRRVSEDKKKAYGLYRSRDNGTSWQLLSKDYNFKHVYLHPDGTLYAIVETYFELPKQQRSNNPYERNAQRSGIRQNVLQSRDLGHSWRDITGSAVHQNLQIFGLFADPDNPGLVCLNGWSTRSYILQADDESYNWQTTVDTMWRKDHETDESFFNRYYGTKSTLYMHQATLGNYFQHEFGTEVDLPAFDIVTEEKAYTFTRDGEKTLNISVEFLPGSPSIKLIDTDTGLACWGIRYISPSGKRIDAGQAGARTGVRNPITTTPGYQIINLSSNRPYERALDLAQLCAFDEIGTYRVQLLYDNTRIPGDLKGRWAGFFASRLFTITITG